MNPARVIAAGCSIGSRRRMRSTIAATTKAAASRFDHVSVTSDVSHRIFSKVSTASVSRSSQSRRESFIAATSCSTAASSPARARRDMRLAQPGAAARCRAGRRFERGRPVASSARDCPAASSRVDHLARAGRRTSAAAAPAGGTAASTGRRAARYSNTLPETHGVAAAVRVRGSGAAARRPRAARQRPAGTAGSRSPPTRRRCRGRAPRRGRMRAGRRRSARSTWPRRSGRRPSRSRRPVRKARGLRWPKNAPVCTIVKRPRRRVVEAREVAQVDPVADHRRLCGGARVEPAQLRRDRLGDGDERVGPRGRRCGPSCRSTARLARAAAAVVAAVGMVEPRVAQVGDPRHAGRGPGDGGADQVHRGRRRGRHDRVDVAAGARSAPRRGRPLPPTAAPCRG